MNTTATKASHTPGPWDYGTEGFYTPEYAKDYDLINQRNRVIGVVKLYCENDERHANARLIAAAPELLEACKFVMKYHNMHLDKADGDELPFQLADAVQAAITKALAKEGGER